MAIEGTLRDMSLSTLVQSVLQEGRQSRIDLKQDDISATLYLDNHHLVHADLTGQGDNQIDHLTGEEVIYEILNWKHGDFTIEQDSSAPTHTIHKNWDFLVMEGLRRLDESRQKNGHLPENESLSDMLQDLTKDDAAQIKALINQDEEQNNMATKTEQIKEILEKVVNDSSEIIGAVLVDKNGLLLASVLGNSSDSNRVAAVSAGLASLAKRSATQLGQGEVIRTLIQADKGNVIVMSVNDRVTFVTLMPPNMNLGMAFLECDDAVQAIKTTL